MNDSDNHACMQCGTEMAPAGREDWPSYAGLPGVLLRGLRVFKCPKCGESEVEIPRIQKLHEALSAVIVAKRAPLVRQERRFLRNFIGWTEEELAQHMGVSPEDVEGWERGDIEAGPVAERLLRLLAVMRLPALSDEILTNISAKAVHREVEMQVDDNGWREAA